MKNFIQVIIITTLLLPGLAGSGNASPSRDARLAIASLQCSYAANVLDLPSASNTFRAVGHFLIEDIYKMYQLGKIDHDYSYSKMPGLFHELTANKKSLSDDNVAVLTQITVKAFSDLDSSYERKAKDKSGIEAYNARKDYAEEVYLTEKCEKILQMVN